MYIPLILLRFCFLIHFSVLLLITYVSGTIIDNNVIGEPKVNCMENSIKLTFHTKKPFTGRIFVKGMINNKKCVKNYSSNTKEIVEYVLINGHCNMRRTRKIGPDQRGIELSIKIIISFHNVFITKVDRAYQCTCFYMEANKVVTNQFDVSLIPTTEVIDTAKMPICTYTVRRNSLDGPIVTSAIIGESVYHVWQCNSDMFSMLVHDCFVDDGAGKNRNVIIDKDGCTNEPLVQDLTYNSQANLAYSKINVFKIADTITTYFQCAVSTCMISEGMCKGKTPPRCGNDVRKRRTIENSERHFLSSTVVNKFNSGSILDHNSTKPAFNSSSYTDYVMDLAAEKIVVLDLDDSATALDFSKKILSNKNNNNIEFFDLNNKNFINKRKNNIQLIENNNNLFQIESKSYNLFNYLQNKKKLCFNYYFILLLIFIIFFLIFGLIGGILWRMHFFKIFRRKTTKF